MYKKVRLSNVSNSRTEPRRSSQSSTNGQFSVPNDFLCDRTIEFMETGDTRNIVAVELAEQSMYFERLVRYHKGRGVIHLPDFLRPGFDAVIEFIQRGRTELSEENVYDVFIAADYFLVSSLKEKCCNFIRQMTQNPSFAVMLWITCRSLHWPELGTMAYDRILEKFEDVWKTDEFLELDVGDVEDVIGNDRLICKNETNVVDCIAMWISADRETRIQLSFDLLKNVRLGLLKTDELLIVANKDIVQSTTNFRQVVESWPQCSIDLCNMLGGPTISKMITPRIPHEVRTIFQRFSNLKSTTNMSLSYTMSINCSYIS